MSRKVTKDDSNPDSVFPMTVEHPLGMGPLFSERQTWKYIQYAICDDNGDVVSSVWRPNKDHPLFRIFSKPKKHTLDESIKKAQEGCMTVNEVRELHGLGGTLDELTERILGRKCSVDDLFDQHYCNGWTGKPYWKRDTWIWNYMWTKWLEKDLII